MYANFSEGDKGDGSVWLEPNGTVPFVTTHRKKRAATRRLFFAVRMASRNWILLDKYGCHFDDKSLIMWNNWTNAVQICPNVFILFGTDLVPHSKSINHHILDYSQKTAQDRLCCYGQTGRTD